MARGEPPPADLAVGGRVAVVSTGTADPASPPQPDGHRLTYRPALDGLRAVAVLAVMAEHAGLRLPGQPEPLVPGGFLGVDVFFAISGFLITSLLLVERRHTGGIDLQAFWLRRARRLLPAVGVMVAGTVVLVDVAAMPLDPATVRGDALASLGYVANWRFVLTDQSYFDAFGLPSPFRHLWSLSLEEQWYLVFPPLLTAAGVVVRRRPGVLLAGLLALAGASTLWMAACYTPLGDPSRAYYGTDTRAHTLLVGAALAVVMVHFPAAARQLARVTPVVGVVGLGVLAVLFHTADGTAAALYRGGFLGVAVASTAVVASVALPGARGPVHALLGLRLPAAVGRLSYGLYLWHWPLFLWLTPDRLGISDARLTAVRFAAAFLVAGASYVLVEQPIRRHGLAGLCARARAIGLPGLRPAMVAGAAAALVVAVVMATSAPGTGSAVASAGSMDDARRRAAVLNGDVPVTTTIVEPRHALPAVPGDRPLRVMFGGDSVGWSIGFALERHDTLPDDVDMSTVANLGCTVTPGVILVDGVRKESVNCPDWLGVWRDVAFAMQPDVVVATWGAWEVHDHDLGDRVLRAMTPEFGAAYEQALTHSMDEVVAVAPDTRFAYVTVPCMEERSPWVGGLDSPRNDPANLAWVNGHTAAVAGRYADRATIVDLGPLICPDGELLETVDGIDVHTDGVHFTSEFAPVVWSYIEEQIRPWLAVPGEAP